MNLGPIEGGRNSLGTSVRFFILIRDRTKAVQGSVWANLSKDIQKFKASSSGSSVKLP